MEIAGVEIELVIFLARGKEQVDLAVVIKIACAYATAVIKIHVVEYVEPTGGMQGIAEVQSCPVMVQRLEQRVFCVGAGGMAAALQKHEDEGREQQATDGKRQATEGRQPAHLIYIFIC